MPPAGYFHFYNFENIYDFYTGSKVSMPSAGYFHFYGALLCGKKSL